MEKQTVAVLGPGSWGTALSQVLNDNGHEVRIWGNLPEQINEINTHHTNKPYFKDVVLNRKYHCLHRLSRNIEKCGCDFVCCPNKSDTTCCPASCTNLGP